MADQNRELEKRKREFFLTEDVKILREKYRRLRQILRDTPNAGQSQVAMMYSYLDDLVRFKDNLCPYQYGLIADPSEPPDWCLSLGNGTKDEV